MLPDVDNFLHDLIENPCRTEVIEECQSVRFPRRMGSSPQVTLKGGFPRHRARLTVALRNQQQYPFLPVQVRPTRPKRMAIYRGGFNPGGVFAQPEGLFKLVHRLGPTRIPCEKFHPVSSLTIMESDSCRSHSYFDRGVLHGLIPGSTTTGYCRIPRNLDPGGW